MRPLGGDSFKVMLDVSKPYRGTSEGGERSFAENM
jgi:hypothetical protein